MEIIRGLLHFDRELVSMNNPQYIIIHHTEEIGWDIMKVHEYHLSLGWNGIGYNYFIDEGGIIIEGRGMNVGAHALGMNEKSIGICVNGNFDLTFPTKEQIKSLKILCIYFMNVYNISIDNIIGHNELPKVTKSCPGMNFNMAEFRKILI